MEQSGKKGEHMTSLYGAVLVPKTHPRIAFRGRIDTLEAEVAEARALAEERGEAGLVRALGEVLDYLGAVMAAEVCGTPLAPRLLFGMSAEEIHDRVSGAAGSAGAAPRLRAEGVLAARINVLRAKTREAELCAARAFAPGAEGDGAAGLASGATAKASGAAREDILLAMNRLSSALWLLYAEFAK